VDEVEAAATAFRGVGWWGRVSPFGFDVVDLKLAVRRHPAGLDGGEVDAEDGCGRDFVSEFNGPDSGAGTEVEDGVGGRWKGGEVEGAVKGETPDVVLEV